jgi:chemotaxis signal transduction protein
VVDEVNQNYVTGVGKVNGRLIILVDLTKIVRRNELRRLSEIAEVEGTSTAAAPAET